MTFAVAPDFGEAPHRTTWTFGDGARDAGTAVTHTYPAPGVYEVGVHVRDAKGRTARAAVTISLPADPDPAGGIAKARDGGNPGFAFRGPGPYSCKLTIRPTEAA